MPSGKPNKRNTAEFRQQVVEIMQEEVLNYNETARRFEVNSQLRIQNWERIYLAEGAEGFAIERRGRSGNGRPTKLCDRDIVSYTISERPILSMTIDMLNKAFIRIQDNTNLNLHSDQGWQYQHKNYRNLLKEKGARQSMSRNRNCLDNAVIVNFFGILKSELLYLQKFESTEHFKAELIDYLGYYDNRRAKAKLEGLPPAIYRQQALMAA